MTSQSSDWTILALSSQRRLARLFGGKAGADFRDTVPRVQKHGLEQSTAGGDRIVRVLNHTTGFNFL